MSLSSDGEFLAVGAPGDDSNNGAVWVFHYDGSAYSQMGSKIVGSGNVGAAYQGTTSMAAKWGLPSAKESNVNLYCNKIGGMLPLNYKKPGKCL